MQTELHETGKNRTRSARVLFLGAALLLALIIFVPPYINVNSLRRSIVQSIRAGLGRPVYASSVELQLFPRPAFVLHHLTVAAEPAFGAEPVITAETVTANLRAGTLWHRRVEIASLHFDAPSVNLVRNDQGEWNFASLIRNSPILRQSGASSSDHPQPFPYVEATEARINFKFGSEKLPFSLESADLAFWKESGNQWHVRIKASPVRTDLPLADTGQVRGEAVITTAADLMTAPIHARLEWRRVQLGEFDRLLHGTDSGWRGMVNWTATAQGTLAKMSVTSEIHVDEFRRAEFVPPSEMDLAARCQAQISQSDRLLDFLKCDAPMGGGHLLIDGNFRGPSQPDDLHNLPPMLHLHSGPAPASMRLTLQHISAGFLLDVFRHVHPGVAAGATASGDVNGHADCNWLGPDHLGGCNGELSTSPLEINLPHLDHSLRLTPLLLTSSPGAEPSTARSAIHSRPFNKRRLIPTLPMPPFPPSTWHLAPTHVALGGTSPATVTGTLTADGPTLNVTGTADLARLYRIVSALSIPAMPSGLRSIQGNAQLALSLESTWLPVLTKDADAPRDGGTAQLSSDELARSRWSGKLQLHNATLRVQMFPGTIQVADAQVGLTPETVEWTGITGSYAHIPLNGSISWQIFCPTAGPGCARTFHLHTSSLNGAHLQEAMRQGPADSSFLARMNPWSGGIPEMPRISGIFDADMLSLGKLSLKNVSLQISVQGHQGKLLALSGTAFGGTLSGIPVMARSGSAGTSGNELKGNSAAAAPEVGSVQWGDGSPVYMLQARLENIHPDEVASIWHEKWGHGVATADIRLKTQGWSAEQLEQNASGNFGIVWKGGSLPALGTDAARTSSTKANGVLRFQDLLAEGTIRNQELVVDSGRMVFPASHTGHEAAGLTTQSLSGTVKFSRVLNLQLQPSGISIAGSLDRPVVKSQPSAVPAHRATGNARF